MSRSVVDFNLGLYREHLEDTGFLYAQRAAQLQRAETGWRTADGIEQRLLAHVDALVIGGDPAARLCVEALESGEPEAVFAAVFHACRCGAGPVVARALALLDASAPSVAAAIADALKLALPPSWRGFLARALANGSGSRRRVLIEVAGFHRIAFGDALTAPDPADDAAEPWLRALGRLRAEHADDALRAHVDDSRPRVRFEAMIALLRIGDRGIPDALASRAPADPMAQLALGVGGNARSLPALRAVVEGPQPTVQGVTALGLLGDPSVAPLLIDTLRVPALASAAAESLQAMSGAGLGEQAFVAEQPNPDEWFDDERSAFEGSGAVPTRKDGKPWGVMVQRITRDADAWRTWWTRYGATMAAGRRHRLGRPFTPAAALDALTGERVHPRLRGLLVDEFVARTGIDAGLEADAFVSDQLDALRRARAAAAPLDATLAPGAWHAAGRAQ